MKNEGKLTIYSFMLYKCNKKICKVGKIFGFEVSHPLSPITKPTLRKPDAQQKLCLPQWTDIRGNQQSIAAMSNSYPHIILSMY